MVGETPGLLACENGVIDLKRNELRDGRPEDRHRRSRRRSCTERRPAAPPTHPLGCPGLAVESSRTPRARRVGGSC
ncbi:MAG: hypothetical protein ACXWZY_04885 [Gaiellaceae bacterium]